MDAAFKAIYEKLCDENPNCGIVLMIGDLEPGPRHVHTFFNVLADEAADAMQSFIDMVAVGNEGVVHHARPVN